MTILIINIIIAISNIIQLGSPDEYSKEPIS